MFLKNDWTINKQFSSWLQAVKHNCKQARCKASLRNFSIHEGNLSLRKHMNSEIYKANMKNFANNILITRTSFSEVHKVSAISNSVIVSAFILTSMRYIYKKNNQTEKAFLSEENHLSLKKLKNDFPNFCPN